MNFLRKLFEANTYKIRLYCNNCHHGEDFLTIEKGKEVWQEFFERRQNNNRVRCSNCDSEDVVMAHFQ